MPLTDQEIEEEAAHFAFVVAAFRNYTAHSVKLETIDWLSADFGSVDLGEQQEEERFLSSAEGRSRCPRKNRIQDPAEERR
jgi:hypothetical protein